MKTQENCDKSSELRIDAHFATFGTLVAYTSTIGRPEMAVHQFQGIHSKGTRMSRFILSAFAIVGVLTLSSGAAFAQHCHGGGYGGGYGGGSYGGQVYSTPSYNYAPQYVSSGYQNYQPSYQNYQPSYQSYQPSYQSYAPSYGYSGNSYHNTSHYDYHAPSAYVHRNHIDVSPGHYDYHRSGHRH